MPSATITLPDGTVVTIDGTPEEVARLLQLYGGGSTASTAATVKTPRPKTSTKKVSGARAKAESNPAQGNGIDLNEIINLIKNCDEAEEIESAILDKVGQVNRILLPLFVAHQHLEHDQGLTTGEISQITKDLGIPIHVANVSNTLSKTAAKYVMGDKVRKKGQPVRYKLSRRGVKYMEDILKGKTDD